MGFVSNSSSSSFVIIDANRGYENIDDSILEVDSNFGRRDFGWGPEKITDIGSRITFSWIQAMHMKEDHDPLVEQILIVKNESLNPYLNMLEEVIKENSNVKEIEWKISIEYDDNDKDKEWAYIDHQSSAEEGCNTEMFESKQKLKDFIFGKDSYIQLDNDNH